MNNSEVSRRESVYARAEELRKAIKAPRQAKSSVHRACASQEELAKWCDREKSITPMSRNTMYKYANVIFFDEFVPEGKEEGRNGYRYLEWLRKNAEASLKAVSKTRSVKGRKQRLAEKKKKQKSVLETVAAHSLSLSKAYLHLLTQIIVIAREEELDPLVKKKLNNLIHDQDRLYSSLFEEVGTVRPDNVERL